MKLPPFKFKIAPWILCCLLCCFTSTAWAATRTFTGPGNFGDATKWSGSTLPAAGDDLILNGNCTVNNSAPQTMSPMATSPSGMSSY